MIRYRQKNYTIPEGHYTGPKDIESVPSAISTITKSTLAGLGIGGAVGSLIKDTGILKGAEIGGKTGFITGILLKILLNVLHNPMSSVKYQEVDKTIRREFGIYRLSGITIGDSKGSRGRLEDKFSFNDRAVNRYKINVAIQNNSVTLYTLGLTDEELDKTSNCLDYYCKKYFGMEYSSKILNERTNSYSVSIIFTNYQVISTVLNELSEVLSTKINLLDNKALVEVSEKRFSDDTPSLDKYRFLKLLSGKLTVLWENIYKVPVNIIQSKIIVSLVDSYNKYSPLFSAKNPTRLNFGNDYLIDSFKSQNLIEPFEYTYGENKKDLNLFLHMGSLLCTVRIGSKEDSLLKGIFKKLNIFPVKVNGKVKLYIINVESQEQLKDLVSKITSSGIVPNIFKR